MDNKFQYSDIKKTKEEILFAIKERVNEITSGDIQNPLYLKGAAVCDTAKSVSGSVKYFDIQCIFYDERGRLCGDLLGIENKREKNIIFGRLIEEFDIEALRTILNCLYVRNRFYNKSGNVEIQGNIKNRILSKRFSLKSLFAGQIRSSSL